MSQTNPRVTYTDIKSNKGFTNAGQLLLDALEAEEVGKTKQGD